MKLGKYIQLYIPKINAAIEKIYKDKINQVENQFLKHYYTELKDYFLSGGKRIRPLLCIATYNAFSKEKEEGNKIIIPSVGVEFLHNASLIHDDIIDKDDFRRGQPAFHYRYKMYHEKYEIKKMDKIDFGNCIGIIGGDSAFFLGLEAFLNNDFEKDLNLEAINYYENAFIDVSNGVLIEMDMVNREDITLEEYITMISLKTGALLKYSTLIGATYAKAGKKQKEGISKFALNLGIIFQIIDDILGTFGNEKVTGKPTDGDIREGKKTCLLISALEKLEGTKKERLVALIEKNGITTEEVEEVKELFKKANVIDACKSKAEQYHEIALDYLSSLEADMNSLEIEFFKDLLDFVKNREF
ncbi:MAG: polyprenyl synthetase family protein [Promethearchaeota archaeon]